MNIYHFNNGKGGGVLSVIRNLLSNKQHAEIKNHVIFTINSKLQKKFEVPDLIGAETIQIFEYSPNWNFYYTCRKLAKLLPDNRSVIIAHDWLELGMVSNLGLKNPVVQILHGDFEYYYRLAYLHRYNIDKFVCVSKVISERLKGMLPDAVHNIHYLRFPVPDISTNSQNFDEINCAYFVNDLTEENKQFHLLPKINDILIANGIKVKWFIAGLGMEERAIKTFFGQNHKNIFFLGHLNSKGINEMLSNCNIMILPSLMEGFPVSVVEAMKKGLVPMVTNWGSATEDLIIEKKTGFLINVGDVEGYAQKIEFLSKNKEIFRNMSNVAISKANFLFDCNRNTLDFENIFIAAENISQSNKPKKKIYGSRLDTEWMPNLITKTLRSI